MPPHDSHFIFMRHIYFTTDCYAFTLRYTGIGLIFSFAPHYYGFTPRYIYFHCLHSLFTRHAITMRFDTVIRRSPFWFIFDWLFIGHMVRAYSHLLLDCSSPSPLADIFLCLRFISLPLPPPGSTSYHHFIYCRFHHIEFHRLLLASYLPSIDYRRHLLNAADILRHYFTEALSHICVILFDYA